jgi:hypothetical protein
MPIKARVPQTSVVEVEKNLDVAVVGVHLDEAQPFVRVRARGKDAQGAWNEEVVTLTVADQPDKLGFASNKGTNLAKIILASRVPSTAPVTALLTRLGLSAPVTVEQLLDAMVNKQDQLTAEDNPA